jgi:membrane protease YdiL (CAAX protease family)
MEPKTRNSLILFLVLTFALSSIFYARSFSGAPLGRVAPLLMWMPGVAAIITQFVFYRTVDGLGWHAAPGRYLALAVLIPAVYCLAIYLPVWLTGIGRFDGSYLGRVLPLLPIAMAVNLLTALGEEIGWRGFLAPAFYRARGFAWAAVATGIIWGLWHVPLIVGGGYDAGTPAWYGIPCFLISVTGMAVMLAWLRLRSDSVWPAAVYHGAHNLLIQGIFDRSTIDTGRTKWITTEFGIGLTIASLIMAIYFWRRRGELPAASTMQPQRPAATFQRI